MKAVLALYLRGDFLDPSEITSALGVQPTQAHRKGDSSTKPGAPVKRTGVWIWSSALIAATPTSSLHVAEFASRFANVATMLEKISGVDEAWIDVLILGEAGDQSELIFSFSPEELAALAGIELPVHFTVNTLGSPDEGEV